MILPIFITAIVGLCISIYAYIVERKIQTEPAYKPACDINVRISCSKPLTSKYANLFFFSNTIIGMIFYTFIACLALVNARTLLLLSGIGGFGISCVLTYILYVKIRSLCLVCTATYIVNVIIVLLAIKNFYI